MDMLFVIDDKDRLFFLATQRLHTSATMPSADVLAGVPTALPPLLSMVLVLCFFVAAFFFLFFFPFFFSPLLFVSYSENRLL